MADEFIEDDQLDGELDPSRHSSSLERLVELALMTELTQEAWFGRGQIVDVLHSTVDAFGHDAVLECGRILRHVQIKSRAVNGATSQYKVNTNLAERPSGCVIWIGWARRKDANRMDLQYRWFGGLPGAPLPDLGDRVAKRAKTNSKGIKLERPGHRVVPLSRFQPLSGTAELLDRLFGPV